MKLQSRKGRAAGRIIGLILAIAAMHRSLAVYAQTYVVSGCKPGTFDYTSMQRPLVGTPPGSTIYICHERYNELFTVQRELSFQRMQLADGDSVVVAYPDGPLSTVARYLGEFTAQVALLWRLMFPILRAVLL